MVTRLLIVVEICCIPLREAPPGWRVVGPRVEEICYAFFRRIRMIGNCGSPGDGSMYGLAAVTKPRVVSRGVLVPVGAVEQMAHRHVRRT